MALKKNLKEVVKISIDSWAHLPVYETANLQVFVDFTA